LGFGAAAPGWHRSGDYLGNQDLGTFEGWKLDPYPTSLRLRISFLKSIKSGIEIGTFKIGPLACRNLLSYAYVVVDLLFFLLLLRWTYPKVLSTP
jgi:hypothetical protein